MKSANVPCWAMINPKKPQTKACPQDIFCNLHGKSMANCDCEDIEWWLVREMDPFVTTVNEFKTAKKNKLFVE